MRSSSRGSPFRGKSSLRGARAKTSNSLPRPTPSPNASGDEGHSHKRSVSFASGSRGFSGTGPGGVTPSFAANLDQAPSIESGMGGSIGTTTGSVFGTTGLRETTKSRDTGSTGFGVGSPKTSAVFGGSNSIRDSKSGIGRSPIPKMNSFGAARDSATSARSSGPAKQAQRFRDTVMGNAGTRPPKMSNKLGKPAANTLGDSPSSQTTFGVNLRPISQGQGNFQDRYQALKKSREIERAEAIRNGYLADPDRPRSLADAITPVGTCQDMCAEFERLERVVQNDVWVAETDTSAGPGSRQQPDEAKMVKKFRRAAAGIDEQLPSDLRPPHILQKTLDYLFDRLISTTDSLYSVHHFVWDRTRAVRNDFSIQQVTAPSDIRTAIECYERIARFHIVCLHQLALEHKPYDKYDAQQEREQLDKTLLSLIQYYDDSRSKVQSPNEAEFRAYCIIFQIQDPVPDLEDRMQTWPQHVLRDVRVQKALELYAAANNTEDAQGPLKPRTPYPIAQAHWGRFWRLLASNQTSYLMACVAEIYFPLMRRTALNAVWSSYRPSGGKKKIDDWTLDELRGVLGFESEETVQTFVEAFGFQVNEREDGVAFLDLDSVAGRVLPDPVKGSQTQRKTELVERKRCRRTLSAVIKGMTVRRAKEAGLIEQYEQPQRDPKERVIQQQGPQQQGLQQREDEGLFVEQYSDEEERDIARQEAQLAEAKARRIAKQEKRSTHESASRSVERNTTSVQSNNIANDVLRASPHGFTHSGTSNPSDLGLSLQSTAKQMEQSVKSPFSSSPFAPPVFPWPSPRGHASSAIGSSNWPPAGTTAAEVTASGNNKIPTPQSQAASRFQFGTPSSVNQKATSSNPSIPSPGPQSPSIPPSFGFSSIRPEQPTFSNPNTSPSSRSQATPNFSWSSLPPTKAPSTPPSVFNFTNPQTAPSIPVSTPALAAGPFQSFEPSRQAHGPAKLSNLPRNQHTFPAPTFTPSAAAQTPLKSTPDIRKANLYSRQASHLKTDNPSITPEIQHVQSSQLQSKIDKERRETQAAFAQKHQHSETLEQLAKELLLGPKGFIQQFVEYSLPSMITGIRLEIEDRRAREQADQFRLSKLTHRFALRWKHIWWKKRLAAHGRARRQRLAQEKDHRRRSKDNSIIATLEQYRRTMSQSPTLPASSETSVPGTPSTLPKQSLAINEFSHSVVSIPDAPPGQVSTQSQSSQAAHSRSQAGPGDRPASSVLNGLRSIRQNRNNRSSRLRHSFLPGEAIKQARLLPSNSLPGDTTRSTYFKLKAMGVNPTNLSSSVDRKRPRSSDSATASSASQAKRPLTEAAASIIERGTPDAKAWLQTAADEDDDSLFASVRQVRQAMSESVAFFQKEVAKKTSLLPLQSSSNGLSLAQSPNAQVSERSRSPSASLVSSTRTATDWRQLAIDRAAAARAAPPSLAVNARELPPAYRNRVSKFLPRERYADVLMDQRNDYRKREKYVPRRFRPVDRPQQSPDDVLPVEEITGPAPGIEQESQPSAPTRTNQQREQGQPPEPTEPFEWTEELIDPSLLAAPSSSRLDETTQPRPLSPAASVTPLHPVLPTLVLRPDRQQSAERFVAAFPHADSMVTPQPLFSRLNQANSNNESSAVSHWHNEPTHGGFDIEDTSMLAEGHSNGAQTREDAGPDSYLSDRSVAVHPPSFEYPELSALAGGENGPFGSMTNFHTLEHDVRLGTNAGERLEDEFRFGFSTAAGSMHNAFSPRISHHSSLQHSTSSQQPSRQASQQPDHVTSSQSSRVEMEEQATMIDLPAEEGNVQAEPAVELSRLRSKDESQASGVVSWRLSSVSPPPLRRSQQQESSDKSFATKIETITNGHRKGKANNLSTNRFDLLALLGNDDRSQDDDDADDELEKEEEVEGEDNDTKDSETAEIEMKEDLVDASTTQHPYEQLSLQDAVSTNGRIETSHTADHEHGLASNAAAARASGAVGLKDEHEPDDTEIEDNSSHDPAPDAQRYIDDEASEEDDAQSGSESAKSVLSRSGSDIGFEDDEVSEDANAAAPEGFRVLRREPSGTSSEEADEDEDEDGDEVEEDGKGDDRGEYSDEDMEEASASDVSGQNEDSEDEDSESAAQARLINGKGGTSVEDAIEL